MTILEVQNVKKIYTTRFGGNQVQALTDVNFTVEEGKYVAIMGESGSGKTTLLNILAAMDKPTGGQVLFAGKDTVRIPDGQRAAFRRDNLGFVFQDFNLLDTFSIRDNILLPLVLARKSYPEMARRLTPVAQKLGISDLLDKFPYEVSGGQKQRTAVAWALITTPKLVLADEPTGALDSKATDSLLRLFEQINAEGQTILMVTHSARAASHARRVLFIKDGVVYHQLRRGAMNNEELYSKISETLTVLATGGKRMRRNFNIRMALTNIKNNQNIYLPYFMAASLIVMLFYSLRSVSFMVANSTAAGGVTMSAMLQMSSWICGILSLVILFYVNSFIMKRRKKEFGLYSILGMEKRHIALVMAWEVLITGAIGIFCGIVLGALFSQLLFLLLLKIVGLPVALEFVIPFQEAAATFVLFGIGFLILLGYDVISVCRTDPIALLRSEKEGEREPRTK